MSFAAIIATRNGTEGSNFHIWNTMTAIGKVSGNSLICIVACDSATVLAKPSSQTSSSFSNVKHATSTAWYTVDEMGRGAREIVLDVVNKFRCRSSGRGIYQLTSFALAHPQGKVPQGDDDSWGRLLWTRVSWIFLLCRKETRRLLEKTEDVPG